MTRKWMRIHAPVWIGRQGDGRRGAARVELLTWAHVGTSTAKATATATASSASSSSSIIITTRIPHPTPSLVFRSLFSTRATPPSTSTTPHTVSASSWWPVVPLPPVYMRPIPLAAPTRHLLDLLTVHQTRYAVLLRNAGGGSFARDSTRPPPLYTTLAADDDDLAGTTFRATSHANKPTSDLQHLEQQIARALHTLLSSTPSLHAFDYHLAILTCYRMRWTEWACEIWDEMQREGRDGARERRMMLVIMIRRGEIDAAIELWKQIIVHEAGAKSTHGALLALLQRYAHPQSPGRRDFARDDDEDDDDRIDDRVDDRVDEGEGEQSVEKDVFARSRRSSSLLSPPPPPPASHKKSSRQATFRLFLHLRDFVRSHFPDAAPHASTTASLSTTTTLVPPSVDWHTASSSLYRFLIDGGHVFATFRHPLEAFQCACEDGVELSSLDYTQLLMFYYTSRQYDVCARIYEHMEQQRARVECDELTLLMMVRVFAELGSTQHAARIADIQADLFERSWRPNARRIMLSTVMNALGMARAWSAVHALWHEEMERTAVVFDSPRPAGTLPRHSFDVQLFAAYLRACHACSRVDAAREALQSWLGTARIAAGQSIRDCAALLEVLELLGERHELLALFEQCLSPARPLLNERSYVLWVRLLVEAGDYPRALGCIDEMNDARMSVPAELLLPLLQGLRGSGSVSRMGGSVVHVAQVHEHIVMDVMAQLVVSHGMSASAVPSTSNRGGPPPQRALARIFSIVSRANDESLMQGDSRTVVDARVVADGGASVVERSLDTVALHQLKVESAIATVHLFLLLCHSQHRMVVTNRSSSHVHNKQMNHSRRFVALSRNRLARLLVACVDQTLVLTANGRARVRDQLLARDVESCPSESAAPVAAELRFFVGFAHHAQAVQRGVLEACGVALDYDESTMCLRLPLARLSVWMDAQEDALSFSALASSHEQRDSREAQQPQQQRQQREPLVREAGTDWMGELRAERSRMRDELLRSMSWSGDAQSGGAGPSGSHENIEGSSSSAAREEGQVDSEVCEAEALEVVRLQRRQRRRRAEVLREFVAHYQVEE